MKNIKKLDIEQLLYIESKTVSNGLKLQMPHNNFTKWQKNRSLTADIASTSNCL